MRFDRAGHDARGLVLRHQGLHQRVVVNDLFGTGLTELRLRLAGSQAFASGLVQLRYESGTKLNG